MTREKQGKTCTVSVSSVANDELHIKRPLVLDDPSLAHGTPEFVLERHRRARKSGALLLTAQTDRIKYRAVNGGENSGRVRPYKYAVAVVDTDAHTAQVFDAELFVTSRVIKNLEALDAEARAREEAVKAVTATDATGQFFRSRLLLGESFGTKKTKSILNSLDRNKIDMNQLATQSGFISKNLDSSIDRIAASRPDAGVAKSAESEAGPSNKPGSKTAVHVVVPVQLAAASKDSILPEHDAAAKDADSIYPMQALIPTEAFRSLDVSALVQAIRSKDHDALGEAMASFGLHEFVSGRMERLLSLIPMPEEGRIDYTVRCLVYLNYLLLFRTLNEGKVNEDLSQHLPLVTEQAIAALLGHFADAVSMASGRIRYKLSTLCKDRLVAYTLILILKLDSHRTNIAPISVALQQPAVKTADYFKAVGCAIDKPSSGEPTKYIARQTGREIPVKMAVLRAPLTIAPAKVFKGRK